MSIEMTDLNTLISFLTMSDNYAGHAWLLIGVFLMVAEVVMPSLGVLGISGIFDFIMGGLLFFDHKTVSEVSKLLVFGVAGTIGVLVFAVCFLVARTLRLRPDTGAHNLIGKTGDILQWQGGRGKIRIHGEIWDATSDVSFRRGDQGKVKTMKGMKVFLIKE